MINEATLDFKIAMWIGILTVSFCIKKVQI